MRARGRRPGWRAGGDPDLLGVSGPTTLDRRVREVLERARARAPGASSHELTAAPRDPMAAVSFGKRIGEGTTQAVERIDQVDVHRRLDAKLADVERALEKLDDGTYGSCDVCGEPIGARAPAGLPDPVGGPVHRRRRVEGGLGAERHATYRAGAVEGCLDDPEHVDALERIDRRPAAGPEGLGQLDRRTARRRRPPSRPCARRRRWRASPNGPPAPGPSPRRTGSPPARAGSCPSSPNFVYAPLARAAASAARRAGRGRSSTGGCARRPRGSGRRRRRRRPRLPPAGGRSSAYTWVGRTEQRERLVDQVAAEVEQQAARPRRRVALPPAAACGSGRHRSKRDSNRSDRAERALGERRCTVRKSPSQRRFWNTVSSRPRAARRPDARRPSADGRRRTACRRRPAARRRTRPAPSGPWNRFGVATTTRPAPPGAAHNRSAGRGSWRRGTLPRLGLPLGVARHDRTEHHAGRRLDERRVEDRPGEPEAYDAHADRRSCGSFDTSSSR